MEALRQRIQETEKTLQNLRDQLAELEREHKSTKWPLSADEYERYGRQLIVPRIGIQGQLRLKESSVLIVGAGGLGCPAAVYLAGAGVGTLGIVDGDVVERSNLHRQILHSTSTVGMLKVESAIQSLKERNPHVEYRAHPEHLSAQNAARIVASYDIVLDCTDHPTSRYLVSDACVLLSKPLVSASALRTDGQLMTLNSPPGAGPCYRCIFPKPPPAETVVSCGDGGIVGPVVGVMGVLQALEALQVLASDASSPPTMLIFSTEGFRSVRLRPRRPHCVACSDQPGITLESLPSMDYAFFCGLAAPVDLEPQDRISATDYARLKDDHVLLDVRERVQFDICSLPGSINMPFSTLQGDLSSLSPLFDKPVFVVCRLGHDSQAVTQRLKQFGAVRDIRGGLKAWKKEVDPDWPAY